MIKSFEIVTAVSKSIIEANTIADSYVIELARQYNGPFSEIIKENFRLAAEKGLPICQDTGILEFFVFLGHEVCLEEPICASLERAVKEVYATQPYRYSIVSDPLFERKNTGDNTPVVCHVFHIKGKHLEIRFLLKGGGSENLSALFMLKPSAEPEEIKNAVVNHIKELGPNACPPLNIGIGIGGTADKAMLISKLALTNPFNRKNPNEKYNELENEILEEINAFKIGYQGLGNGISAYSVSIEYYPTHIATLPVAVSVDCFICRKGRIIFEDKGT